MDNMLELARSTPQRITFPIRASLARDSWNKFLWLVEQDDRSASIPAAIVAVYLNEILSHINFV